MTNAEESLLDAQMTATISTKTSQKAVVTARSRVPVLSVETWPRAVDPPSTDVVAKDGYGLTVPVPTVNILP